MRGYCRQRDEAENNPPEMCQAGNDNSQQRRDRQRPSDNPYPDAMFPVDVVRQRAGLVR